MSGVGGLEQRQSRPVYVPSTSLSVDADGRGRGRPDSDQHLGAYNGLAAMEAGRFLFVRCPLARSLARSLVRSIFE